MERFVTCLQPTSPASPSGVPVIGPEGGGGLWKRGSNNLPLGGHEYRTAQKGCWRTLHSPTTPSSPLYVCMRTSAQPVGLTHSMMDTQYHQKKKPGERGGLCAEGNPPHLGIKCLSQMMWDFQGTHIVYLRPTLCPSGCGGHVPGAQPHPHLHPPSPMGHRKPPAKFPDGSVDQVLKDPIASAWLAVSDMRPAGGGKAARGAALFAGAKHFLQKPWMPHHRRATWCTGHNATAWAEIAPRGPGVGHCVVPLPINDLADDHMPVRPTDGQHPPLFQAW